MSSHLQLSLYIHRLVQDPENIDNAVAGNSIENQVPADRKLKNVGAYQLNGLADGGVFRQPPEGISKFVQAFEALIQPPIR